MSCSCVSFSFKLVNDHFSLIQLYLKLLKLSTVPRGTYRCADKIKILDFDKLTLKTTKMYCIEILGTEQKTKQILFCFLTSDSISDPSGNLWISVRDLPDTLADTSWHFLFPRMLKSKILAFQVSGDMSEKEYLLSFSL